MSARIFAILLLLLNVSCTSVFDSSDLNSLSSALSKYNDLAYFVDMNTPISVTSQSKLSKTGLDYNYTCYYDQSLNDSVSNINNCSNLNNFFFNPTSGDFSWTPDETQSGDYEFKIRVSAEIKGKTTTQEKYFKAYIKQVPWFSLKIGSKYETGDSTPKIIFSNFLNIGDSVSIYKDSSCSQNLVSQKINTIEDYRSLESYSLPEGQYNFYMKATINDINLPCIDTKLTHEFKLPVDTVKIFSTDQAFASLKTDGSVVTWGLGVFGGESSSVSLKLVSNITNILSTDRSFFAVKANGSTIAWGKILTNLNQVTIDNYLSGLIDKIIDANGTYLILKKDSSLVLLGDYSTFVPDLRSGL